MWDICHDVVCVVNIYTINFAFGGFGFSRCLAVGKIGGIIVGSVFGNMIGMYGGTPGSSIIVGLELGNT